MFNHMLMFVFPFTFLMLSMYEVSLPVTHGVIDYCILNQAGSFVLQILPSTQ